MRLERSNTQMYDIIKCSAINCPYESSCYRKLIEPEEDKSTWYDYSYQCDFDSGFEQYIKVINNQC